MAVYSAGPAGLQTLLEQAGVNPAVYSQIDNFLNNNSISSPGGPVLTPPGLMTTMAVAATRSPAVTPSTTALHATANAIPANLTLAEPTSAPTYNVLLEFGSAPVTADTDALVAPQIIIDVAAKLTVDGGNNVAVVTGNANALLDINDSGNDLVIAGNGNDTIQGGGGADSISAGSGHDLISAGSGSGQWLTGGSGFDTLTGGSGADDTLTAGSGVDVLRGGTGANQLLDARLGTGDTLFAGSGGDTLLGGAGDIVHVGDLGNDTIQGGGGASAVYFDQHANDAHVTISAVDSSGVTTITFADTHQVVKVSDVTTLHFSDGTTHTI